MWQILDSNLCLDTSILTVVSSIPLFFMTNVRIVLWHVDLLLCSDHEITMEHPLPDTGSINKHEHSGVTVFSTRSVLRCYKQCQLVSDSCGDPVFVSCCCGQGPFRNSEEGEHSHSEAAIKQGLVKMWLDTSVEQWVNCKCSHMLYQRVQ
jgi:hypothetical protein